MAQLDSLTFMSSHQWAYCCLRLFTYCYKDRSSSEIDVFAFISLQGFRRVYDALPDIVLDVPSAYTLLERFAGMCHRDGVITTALLRELPQRSVWLFTVSFKAAVKHLDLLN